MDVDSFHCTYCLKLVTDSCSSIYCDICNSWIHSKCLKFSNSYLRELGSSDNPFYCPKCISNELPFMFLSRAELKTVFNFAKKNCF